MARLLPLFVFLVVGIVLAVARQSSPARPRDWRTYRPKARARSRSGAADAGVCAIRRSDLAGLRDAYSGEPLDPSRPLLRCGGCQSLYHSSSAGVLARENGGRCAGCGGADFAAVRIIGD